MPTPRPPERGSETKARRAVWAVTHFDRMPALVFIDPEVSSSSSRSSGTCSALCASDAHWAAAASGVGELPTSGKLMAGTRVSPARGLPGSLPPGLPDEPPPPGRPPDETSGVVQAPESASRTIRDQDTL
jgi:hypothetical protein